MPRKPTTWVPFYESTTIVKAGAPTAASASAQLNLFQATDWTTTKFDTHVNIKRVLIDIFIRATAVGTAKAVNLMLTWLLRKVGEASHDASLAGTDELYVDEIRRESRMVQMTTTGTLVGAEGGVPWHVDFNPKRRIAMDEYFVLGVTCDPSFGATWGDGDTVNVEARGKVLIERP